MKEFVAMAQAAIEMMPPTTRFREEDKAVILKNKDVLLGMSEDLIQAFYNTLYSHAQTSAVFHEGERPMREETLRNFWLKTVNGPIDDNYFGWMAMVGLVHVVRHVENPMMIAMADFMANFVTERTGDPELSTSFSRLARTISAVVVYGFDQATSASLREIVGMESQLLQRLVNQEATKMLDEARANR